jgi:hypothetical protein
MRRRFSVGAVTHLEAGAQSAVKLTLSGKIDPVILADGIRSPFPTPSVTMIRSHVLNALDGVFCGPTGYLTGERLV